MRRSSLRMLGPQIRCSLQRQAVFAVGPSVILSAYSWKPRVRQRLVDQSGPAAVGHVLPSPGSAPPGSPAAHRHTRRSGTWNSMAVEAPGIARHFDASRRWELDPSKCEETCSGTAHLGSGAGVLQTSHWPSITGGAAVIGPCEAAGIELACPRSAGALDIDDYHERLSGILSGRNQIGSVRSARLSVNHLRTRSFQLPPMAPAWRWAPRRALRANGRLA